LRTSCSRARNPHSTGKVPTRLTNNQPSTSTITQRRTEKAKPPNPNLLKLDILIADAYSTRPYETYSGGEVVLD
jgi:exonuclease SbcC